MEFRALWLRTEAQGLNSILIENLLILVDGFRAIQRCILFEQPLPIFCGLAGQERRCVELAGKKCLDLLSAGDGTAECTD